MNAQKRDQIQRSLRSLAEAQAATMALMEQTLALICDELSLDPLSYFRVATSSPSSTPIPEGVQRVVIDSNSFIVTFRKKACFLGNTLPFKFLARLAKRPNTYVSYENLLSDVWDGNRTDSTVRSVVKSLRKKLREANLADLADAIDGSVRGHYALKLNS